jgi:nucleotide-binding universal stress UspA family protein
MTTRARKIILAIDDSDCSITAAKWACETLVHPGVDEVHLVGCQALITAGMGPALPVATAGSVAALTATYQESVKQEEQRVKSLLISVKNEILKLPGLHLHALPAAGGASGVGESIVSWAKHEHADVVVLGSRGMGAVKSTFMSVVGLGSVSEYCLHHLDRGAVVIVHGTDLLSKKKDFRKVMVAVDDSEHAVYAQQCCIENLLGPKDELHIVSVALPVPYVVSYG